MNSWNALSEWIRSRTRIVLALLGLAPEPKSEQLTLPFGELKEAPVRARTERSAASRYFSR